MVGVEWDRATSAEARDLVLWLGQAVKPRRSPRTKSATTAGSINPITRKRLPPLLLQAGTNEVLPDDSTRMAARARDAGVDVILDVTADVPHGFQTFVGILDEADEATGRRRPPVIELGAAASSDLFYDACGWTNHL